MNCVLRHLFPLLLGAGCALRPAGSVGPVASPGEKALEITVLDVGHGDATLVRSPRGDTLLIDGGPVGPQTADLLATLRRWDALPPDHMIVTHRDPAHLGGIVFLLSGPDAQPGTDDDLKRRLRDAEAREDIAAEAGAGNRLRPTSPPCPCPCRSLRGRKHRLNTTTASWTWMTTTPSTLTRCPSWTASSRVPTASTG